ncbi:MAG: hypothetical protein R3181_10305 [Rubricoccaceae bacterium]|nr:hypothetical protein [Rubricoccaceae bacterium]
MRLPLVILVVLSLWATAPDARPVAPPAPPAVAADTIRTTVQAGEALIVALPAEHDGREATYRVAEAPALSWLVDRSFYWQTLPSERGLRLVRFERTAGGARSEFVVAVEVVGG